MIDSKILKAKIVRNVFLIKTVLYMVIAIPLLEILYSLYHDLFFDPIDEILQITGINTLRLLIATLCITPLVDIFKWKRLNIYRRMLGVSAFCYLILHGLVWSFRQELNLNYMMADIVKHNYIIVGLLSAVLLFALTVTSMDRVIKTMGFVRWKKLHRLAYPAIFLGALHYVMQDKSGLSMQPYVYMGIIVILLLYRFSKAYILKGLSR